jgi:hypothetical protein
LFIFCKLSEEILSGDSGNGFLDKVYLRDCDPDSFYELVYELNWARKGKRGKNKGSQVATYGERKTERMSIAAWIVCGLVFVESSTKIRAKSPFLNSMHVWTWIWSGVCIITT